MMSVFAGLPGFRNAEPYPDDVLAALRARAADEARFEQGVEEFRKTLREALATSRRPYLIAECAVCEEINRSGRADCLLRPMKDRRDCLRLVIRASGGSQFVAEYHIDRYSGEWRCLRRTDQPGWNHTIQVAEAALSRYQASMQRIAAAAERAAGTLAVNQSHQ